MSRSVSGDGVFMLAALLCLSSGCWVDRALMLPPAGQGAALGNAPDPVDRGLGAAARVAALGGIPGLAAALEAFRRLRQARREQQRTAEYGRRAISLAEVVAEIAQEFIPAERKGAFLARVKSQAMGHGMAHDLEWQHAKRRGVSSA